MSNTLSPSSGPHSYTRVLPYGESTSLAPGNASGGYGNLWTSSAARKGMSVSFGERKMVSCLFVFKDLDTDRRKKRLPSDAAPRAK